MRLGKNMRHCLKFVYNHPGWHDYDKRNRATRDAIKRLLVLGLIEANKYNQFRLTE